MPLYTYKCRHCGFDFDTIQGMTEEPYTKVPHEHDGTVCPGEVYRVIGGVAVQYKGHGFHNTDYSRK